MGGESMEEGIPANQERLSIMNQSKPAIEHQGRPAIMNESKPAIEHQGRPSIMHQSAIEHQERPAIMNENKAAIEHQERPAILYENKAANKPAFVFEKRPIVSYQDSASRIRKMRAKANQGYNLYNTDLKCNNCEETFKTRSALNHHQKNCSIKGYNCVECGKSFPSQKSLSIHRGRMHKQRFVG